MTGTARSGGALRLLVMALTAFLLVAFTPMRLGFVGLASAGGDDKKRGGKEDARMREEDENEEVRSTDDDDDDTTGTRGDTARVKAESTGTGRDDTNTGTATESKNVRGQATGTGGNNTATGTDTESVATAGTHTRGTADTHDTTGDQKTADTTNTGGTGGGPAASAFKNASTQGLENGAAFNRADNDDTTGTANTDTTGTVKTAGETADTTGTVNTAGKTADTTGTVNTVAGDSAGGNGGSETIEAQNAAASSPIGDAEVGMVAAGMFLALAGSGYAMSRRRRHSTT